MLTVRLVVLLLTLSVLAIIGSRKVLFEYLRVYPWADVVLLAAGGLTVAFAGDGLCAVLGRAGILFAVGQHAYRTGQETAAMAFLLSVGAGAIGIVFMIWLYEVLEPIVTKIDAKAALKVRRNNVSKKEVKALAG